MNNQQTYDKVKAHLLAQGKAAVNDKGECVYRAPDGSQCGIGCLIDDDQYDPGFEGNGVHTMGILSAVEASGCKAARKLFDVAAKRAR